VKKSSGSSASHSSGSKKEGKSSNKKADKKGKKDEKSEGSGMFEGIERKEFLKTAIPDLDDFFDKVAAPLDTLCDISESIDNSVAAFKEIGETPQVYFYFLKLILTLN
jgi:hypothetical protein